MDDIELTKMVWYEQIKPNTSSRVEGTQVPAKPMSPVLAQKLMDTPGRIPRANEAWEIQWLSNSAIFPFCLKCQAAWKSQIWI